MADQWLFKSETYDNCNCAVNCGCQFNLPSTHGYCQSAFVGNIVAGHFNDTPLAGLKWAGLYKWPGEIAEGNGKRQIIIDERADAAQRVALETIISGGACALLMSNFFSGFASTCSEFCETLLASITASATFGHSASPDNVTGEHIMSLQWGVKVCVKHFDNFLSMQPILFQWLTKSFLFQWLTRKASKSNSYTYRIFCYDIK